MAPSASDFSFIQAIIALRPRRCKRGFRRRWCDEHRLSRREGPPLSRTRSLAVHSFSHAPTPLAGHRPHFVMMHKPTCLVLSSPSRRKTWVLSRRLATAAATSEGTHEQNPSSGASGSSGSKARLPPNPYPFPIHLKKPTPHEIFHLQAGCSQKDVKARCKSNASPLAAL